MSKKQKRVALLGDILGCLVALVIFIIPFYFMLLTALKDKKNAGLMRLSLPDTLHWENFAEVFEKEFVMLDENDAFLGKISDVITAGGADVYIIKNDGAKDLLLPALKEVVNEINLDEGFVKVTVPDGLL